MMTKEDLPVLVFATHNANKAAEVERMLEGRYRILTLNDIGCNEEIIEDATTLEGNAQIKARYVKTQYGLDCFADDTGLEVDALDGLPGVKTARYGRECRLKCEHGKADSRVGRGFRRQEAGTVPYVYLPDPG